MLKNTKMVRCKFILIACLVTVLFASCGSSNEKDRILTVYHVNDVHGQLKNMAKIKHIVDRQRKQNTTILVSAGDMFSGNPVVDNYKIPGYPMIDIMNQTGFAVAEFGNHEFDYGDKVLAERVAQSDFSWLCANADLSNTPIHNVSPFQIIEIDGISILFFGIVETGGMQNALIPSTHPWDVKNITFQKAQDVLPQYANLKQSKKADVYIALSHLGYEPDMEGMIGDLEMAQQFPYFDAIIGGHTHEKIDTTINNVGIFQADSYLNYLGQIDFKIANGKAEIIQSQLIDLNAYAQEDEQLAQKIEQYYSEMNPILNEEIGYSGAQHSRMQVGCFFTDALRASMEVDLCIQNTGGIRSELNEGSITVREIYEIDPFNNGTIRFEMTVGEVKRFFKESNSGFYYSGLNLTQKVDGILITDAQHQPLSNSQIITVGMNDYAAAVHHRYFPDKVHSFDQTTAEMLISYLRNTSDTADYTMCERYFK